MNGESSDNKQSLAKGFMVLTISMMSVKILSLLYTPLLNHILGKDGYGVYSSTYTIFTFIYTIANAGIPVAITKLVSELEAKGNYKDAIKTFKISRTLMIILGLILSLFMVVFAVPLNYAFDSPRSIIATRWLAPGVLFTTIMCAYKGYFQGTGNMTPTATSQVGEQILNIIFSLSFAYLLIGKGPELGAAGGTIGTVIGAMVASLYFLWVYKKHDAEHKKKNADGVRRLSNNRIIKSILKYAIPITIASALQNAGPIVDLKIVRSRLLSVGFDPKGVDIQWGYLSLYNTLISIPMAIIGALAIALVPTISRSHVLGDKKTLRFNIKSSYRITFMVAIPCAVGLGVLSIPILKILGYANEVSPLLIYGSWVLVLSAISLVQTSILQGIGKVNLVTIYFVIGIIIKVVVNYILVATPLGILGAVIGNAAFYIVIVLLFQLQITKSLGVRTSFIACGIKPLIAGIGMGIITYLSYGIFNGIFGFVLGGYILNLFTIIISIIIAVLSYGIFLVSIGGVRKSDLNSMPNKLTKFIPQKIYGKLR